MNITYQKKGKKTFNRRMLVNFCLCENPQLQKFKLKTFDYRRQIFLELIFLLHPLHSCTKLMRLGVANRRHRIEIRVRIGSSISVRFEIQQRIRIGDRDFDLF